MLLATDAASEGLNLQHQCCRLYHFELPWNPNRLEQRNGRIDRHGQTRPPVIRYLFYPDSPEDRVLDRLVQRISTMHDDRVSTPDILGILEGSRLDDVLGRIESAQDGEAQGASLMQLFEARQEEFAYQIAPFLVTGAKSDSNLPYANAVSADPIIEDDSAFERVVLEALRGGARAGPLPNTWRLDVPRHLQGAGVAARYACATFRRSVAARLPATEVEFIHRLHPLARELGAHALAQLTLEPARNNLASRIAVRRHATAGKQPFVLFTFLERESHPAGIVFGIAIDPKGGVLDQKVVDAVLAEDNRSPGEVDWTACERAFGKTFAALQSKAAAAAREHVEKAQAKLRSDRAALAGVLREEASLYKVDRLAEIDEDERTERAGTREQMELFREAATNWQARRAAVETHYSRRLADIEQFTELSVPADPQPLGALLVFAPA